MKKLFAALFLCSVLSAADKPGVWLDVPFVKQEKDACGAASIAMVMQYWLNQGINTGPAPNPAEIQRQLYSREGGGIYSSDLEHYFQKHGFRTFAFQGTWDDLKQHLGQGRPLIVALKPSRGSSNLHYVVVAGLDGQQAFVLVNDPAERKLLKQDWRDFERQWSAVGKWTLLAIPQSQPH